MGRYFALSLSLPANVPNKNKVKRQPIYNMRINWSFWIVALAFVVGISYLVQVNAITTKGYEIKKMEQLLTEQKETQKRLELEMAELKSIQSIESEVKTLNLVPSGDMNYFKESKYALEQ